MPGMTHRERMLAVLQGCEPDRLPWMPRLEMWYKAHQKAGTLPEKYRGWDIRSIYRDQDMGFPGKWGVVFRTKIEGVEIVTREKAGEIRREIITPVGTVSTLYKSSSELSAQGIHGLEVEHMIKGPGDYAVMEWIYEHTITIPTYEEY
ncbi:MAG: hypothetical protein H5T69_17290, partial [Chloroflexi bacterium]|nr:hypothetical protein [Chloroflexota bacterium]